jgi:hypothetical protein
MATPPRTTLIESCFVAHTTSPGVTGGSEVVVVAGPDVVVEVGGTVVGVVVGRPEVEGRLPPCVAAVSEAPSPASTTRDTSTHAAARYLMPSEDPSTILFAR